MAGSDTFNEGYKACAKELLDFAVVRCERGHRSTNMPEGATKCNAPVYEGTDRMYVAVGMGVGVPWPDGIEKCGSDLIAVELDGWKLDELRAMANVGPDWETA